MKIVGVISFMNSGGAQEALLRLARQMRSRGHDMEVWFLYEVAAAHRGEPGVRVFFQKPRLSLFEYASCLVQVAKALRMARPDAAIGFLPLGNVIGLTAAWMSGISRRVASHRSPGTTYGRLMRLLDRIAGSLGVYRSIVCVSGAVLASFHDYPAAYRRRLRVVHNGIEWAPSDLTPAQSRAHLNLPEDRFIVAAVGRLSYQKNYSFLLKILAATPNVMLAIAGDGEDHAQLQQEAVHLGIDDRVLFLGVLKRQDIRHLLRASDAFVQPSLFEGQSNALLEAMHEGLAVLVSDIPEQRETIFDESTGETAGMLRQLNDTAGWVDALTALRDDPACRRDLGKAAGGMVVRRFSLDRMTRGFESALLEMSDGKH